MPGAKVEELQTKLEQSKAGLRAERQVPGAITELALTADRHNTFCVHSSWLNDRHWSDDDAVHVSDAVHVQRRESAERGLSDKEMHTEMISWKAKAS